MWTKTQPECDDDRKYYFWRPDKDKCPIPLRVDTYGVWWGAALIDYQWKLADGEWWSEPIQGPSEPLAAPKE